MTRWPVVPLKKLCQVSRSMVAPVEADYDDLPSLGLEQIESGTGAISMTPGSKSGEGRSVNFRFDQRHVLYGKLRPYLNKVALPDFEGRCSTELVPLLPNGGVEREFLALLLRRQETVRAVMAANTGARMPRADMNVLMSLSVVCPQLTEQRRIVDLLNHANSIRRLRREAQEKARQVIPALFVEMFGDPRTNPKGWASTTVAELLCSADYGTSQKPLEGVAGIPVIRMGNVSIAGDLLLKELKHVELPSSEYQKYRLRRGDLLFNRTNSKDLVGKTGIWDGPFEAVAASYFIRLRVRDDRANPSYLWAFFNSRHMKQRLFETARGAIGQANINAKEVRAFPIEVPPLKLQHRFAERLADIQAIIAQQDRMAAASEQMADALMAKVFQSSA